MISLFLFFTDLIIWTTTGTWIISLTHSNLLSRRISGQQPLGYTTPLILMMLHALFIRGWALPVSLSYSCAWIALLVLSDYFLHHNLFFLTTSYLGIFCLLETLFCPKTLILSTLFRISVILMVVIAWKVCWVIAPVKRGGKSGLLTGRVPNKT